MAIVGGHGSSSHNIGQYLAKIARVFVPVRIYEDRNQQFHPNVCCLNPNVTLVGGFNPSEKILVNRKDYPLIIPYIMEHIKCS